MAAHYDRSARDEFYVMQQRHDNDTLLRLTTLTKASDSFSLFCAVERNGKLGVTRCRFRATDDQGNVYTMREMVNFDDGHAVYAPIVLARNDNDAKAVEEMRRRVERRMHWPWRWLPYIPPKAERQRFRQWRRAIEGKGPILQTGAGVAYFYPVLSTDARELRVEMIEAQVRERDRTSNAPGFIMPEPFPGPWIFTISLPQGKTRTTNTDV